MQLRALCEALEHFGVAPAELQRASMIEEKRFADSNASFSLEEFDHLMVVACQLSKDPAFGLHWGEQAPLAQFEQLTIVSASAPSLRAVLTMANRFQPLLSSRDEYHFSERDGRCFMRCEVLAVSAEGIRIRSEFLIAATRRMLHYFGAARDLKSVRVPYPRPDHVAEYERLFGPIVSFDQAALRVEFSRESLDRTRGPRDPALHHLLRERIETLRQHALGQLTFTEQTEAVVRAALPRLLSMTEVASALDVSERSLRRRLAEDHTDFSSVVERVRHTRAEELLAAGMRSVKEIASESGYSGVSAFYRAFRRWTGDTPGRRRAPRAKPR